MYTVFCFLALFDAGYSPLPSCGLNPAGHRQSFPRSAASPACSPSRPSSIEEGPLTSANFSRKCLECRFRFREWTVIFCNTPTNFHFHVKSHSLLLTVPGLHYRHDDGFLASEVPVLSEVSDTQIPFFQKERRLIPRKTWWNFGKKEKG